MKIGKMCVHIYLHGPIQIIRNKLWYMYKTTGLRIELYVANVYYM